MENGQTKTQEITNGGGYTIALTGIMRQKVENGVASFVPDNGDHCYRHDLNIQAGALDPANFLANIIHGRDYHYEATYTVTPASGNPTTLTHRFIIYPRPLTVTPKGGEVEQSKIKDFVADDFELYCPLETGTPPLGFTTNSLMKLIDAQVTDSAGSAVEWNQSTPTGRYRVRAVEKPNVVFTSFFQFTFNTRDIVVTGPKYHATLSVGGNGKAVLTSGSNPYVFGNTLRYTATPDAGYMVDKWTATFQNGTNPVTQTGGAIFDIPTRKSDMTVSVTFREKSNTLTLLPRDYGKVTATVNGTAVVSGNVVQEGATV